MAIPDDRERAEKQLLCATWLAFRAAAQNLSTWHLYAANFCQQTHTCEGCAVARSGRLLQSVFKATCGLLAERPQLEAHFITLTIRDGEDLADRYRELHGGLLATMDRRRQSRSGRSGSPLASCVGGFGQIETKLGRNSKLWHPHYHGVWFFERKPDYGALRSSWCSAIGYEASTKFKLLGAEELRRAGYDHSSDEYREALVKGLCEVTKYSCKFHNGEFEHLWAAARFYRSKRARLFRRFGDVIGVEEPTDLCESEVDWETVEFMERIYRFEEEERCYIEDQRPQRVADFDEWNARNGV